MNRLKDKVALIAGAGPGMGRATALLFAQEGAKVGVIARDPAKGEETARRVTEAGGEVIALAGDLSVRTEAEKTVNTVIERWSKLDVLYYGAGGFFRPDKEFDDIDEQFWNLALTNTLNGLFNLAQITRPYLRGGGSIVAIAASFNVRQAGTPVYHTVKNGVIGLCQSLAQKFYADDIRVNVIGAGLFRAPLADGPVQPVTGLARTGRPEDIAYAALYLSSDEAGWVTGQVLNVDGGVDVGTRPLWQFER